MEDPSLAQSPNENEIRSWMLRAKSGDRTAMGSLYQLLLPLAVAYLRRRMGPKARRWVTAESLASEVLFETILGLATLAETATKTDLYARLFRIAKSRLWDVLRKHHNERGESGVLAARAEPRTPEVSTNSVTRADDRRLLREMVSRLKEGQGEAVRLCGLEGKTYAEAGGILGLEPDTVRKRYHSGLIHLCRLVSGRAM